MGASPVLDTARFDTVAVDAINAPDFSLAGITPLLCVFGAAAVGVLVEAFAPRNVRHPVQVAVALAGTLGALVACVLLAGTREVTAAQALAVDGAGLFLQATIAGLGALSILLFAERSLDPARSSFVASAAVPAGSARDRELMTAQRVQTEVYPLATFAIAGMMLFTAANDLLIMFVALEVLSLPLYLLAGMARRRRLLSQEAALKYFLLGAFASAFFLYGLALVYGSTGSVQLADIRAAGLEDSTSTLPVIGLGLLIVGLMFKASVAPFHTWTPDVYQGSPTPVTAFMAACTKVAAFGAILRLLYVAFGDSEWTWRPLVYGIAIVSMLVGAVLGLTQTDVKRMLAYSSIAHAGFLLTGVLGLGPGGTGSGLQATMFYLLAYGISTVGVFAVVTLVRDGDGEATHLSQWAGLARRSPLTAAIMTLFLLALAGIPLTSGFIGKFTVFRAAIEQGAWPLVVVALVASAIAAFYYLKLVVLMYFSDPAEDGPTVGVPGLPTTIVLAVTVSATLVLGVVPGAVLELAERAAIFGA
ncbi:NADH-quinone oxidoreductase subunit NuoN [Modestobacter sp. I12A-02628]|uniref:NADH-quinone oxidoreductase subunit N n=1 Tax=Goekera deserti TaxID=2497753 RepID=A0A7K3W9W2_9ACTN|nr:NADH-quinone oxidoreductase subunit NuoN [Goekera deserti]MPR00567.1 NADH-quinone oxidoreductase subunit NuoN [Goekera deserti]NDI50548.1 NADH-quinone oxidoreductase subunit NuoN [Goekera deserti]NEL52809.1 NADH-quinone oxidoreductase subunit NuoN [Goekera deserti]